MLSCRTLPRMERIESSASSGSRELAEISWWWLARSTDLRSPEPVAEAPRPEDRCCWFLSRERRYLVSVVDEGCVVEVEPSFSA